MILLFGGLILFVPIRYRAKARKSEKLSVHFIGSWLLHLFHISVRYDGEVPVIKLRIVGIPVFDSSKEKSEKKVKTKKAKKIKKKQEKREYRPESEEIVNVMELKTEEPIQNSLSSIEDNKIEKTIEKERIDSENDMEEKLCEEKTSLWKKITQWFLLVKKTIRNFRSICQNLWKKVGLIKEFIQKEDNKKGFSSIFGSSIQILKKIGPAVIKGKIQFGTGDPCSTGQALGVLGICYGWIGDQIEIEPDFENEVLKGELFIKGRFRVISLLIIGVKLLKDEGFKKLRNNFAKLKEEI